jgi:4-carboxymuconolactone decarboxylase
MMKLGERHESHREMGRRLSRLMIAMGAAALVTSCAAAQTGTAGSPAAAQQLIRAGSQTSTTGSNDYFTGRVRVDPLSPASNDINASTAYVTFEPGARSAWHVHPRGQVLVVTAGAGLTQEWGRPVQEIRPGDVVRCPPGVKHWHGAAPTSAMIHLAVTGTVDGMSVTWMEKVTDEQYVATGAPAPERRETMAARLSSKEQAIPLIASFMATSDMAKLNAALNEGLDSGMTINEAKEVLVQLYAYVGFPRSLNALGELMRVVQGRKDRGIQDALGREPNRVIPTGDELLTIGTANQTKISGAPVQGPLFDFAPAIHQYLRTHLFGDIFERDNLDWQSRELATVGALAATPGVEPQLRSHMGASMRVGLTVEHLRQVIEVLAERGEAEAAQRATEALAQALTTRGRTSEHIGVHPRD